MLQRAPYPPDDAFFRFSDLPGAVRLARGRVVLFPGDCLTTLDQWPANCVDAVVTDPPYHLQSIVKRFGSPTAAPAQFGTDGAYARMSRGFMGFLWDGGDIAFRPETWAAVMRVLKPGGHMVAFGGDRTYHRLACAIEDAGFEVRRTIVWAYGQGMPKSLDVGKAIDRAAGAVRKVARDIPATDAAQYHDGTGSDLKTGF